MKDNDKRIEDLNNQLEKLDEAIKKADIKDKELRKLDRPSIKNIRDFIRSYTEEFEE